MFATLRAAVSLLALVGFYVYAVALIAGVIVGAFLLRHSLPGLAIGWVIAGAAGAGLVVIATLWAVVTWRPQPMPGVDVTPEEAPELWALVTELSAAAGTRGPAQIRLVSQVNAAVNEDSRFLGLIGGPRRMYLGVPLLQGLNVTQLRAVLAHEFGHFSRTHTRLGPIAYRGWQAIVMTLQQLHGNIFQWPLRFYAAVYILLSLGMSRSQEREADRLMVKIVGRSNAQDALREILVIEAFWSHYDNEYLGLGWGFDLAPTAEGFFGGFERLLAARADERDALRDKMPPEEPAEKSTREYAMEMLASHPPTAVRIAAMETLPDRTAPPPDDDRPASALIPAFAKAAAATAEEVYVFGYRERLEWDDLVARAGPMTDQNIANAVYPVAAQLAEEPAATLQTVVALAEAGRAAELVKAVAPDTSAENLDKRVTGMFIALVRAAAVHAGAASWRISWSGPLELTMADGEIFDAQSLAALLVNPNTARDAVDRLTTLGIDVTTAGPVAAAATADVGQVVGGISDMKSGDATYDVLILDTGLVLAEKPGDTADGWTRLDTLQRSGSTAEIIARHRFVPYASMASWKDSGWRTGGMTVNAEITLADGTKLGLKEKMSSEYLMHGNDETLKSYLRRIR